MPRAPSIIALITPLESVSLAALRKEHIDALLFSAKAAVSALLAVWCFGLFHLNGMVWAPISAVIVTQPTLHPSVRASLYRVAANLIGAFIGAALITAIGRPMVSMAVGVLLTGLACYFAKLDDAVRPAYAAVVIVTLGSETHAWVGSMDRVLGVTVGCVCALAVGFVFSKVLDMFSGKERKL